VYAGLTDLTAQAIAAWFVRLLLWVRRKNGINCRQCGAAIPIPDAARFVSEGCLACGSKKIAYV